MTKLPLRRSVIVNYLTAILGLLSWLAALGDAQAQAVGRLVVIPSSTHELTEAEQRAADLVESGLSARRIRLVSMHEARDRAQAESRPPASPDNSDLDVLAREAHAALEHVAFGRSGAAQKSVQEVLSRAERALENLNRETKTARHVLDACLALVRNALTRDERRDALAEAMRCRRLVPDVSPSEMLHPASVIGVLAEADDQLRRMRIGRLTVESKPETGCATYVNGRHLGVTPFRMDRAAAGEYRVQVECSRTQGRVHMVQLGDDAVDLVVDAVYDRVVRSGTRLALVYENEKEQKRLLDTHGAKLGRTVRADEAILVRVAGPDAFLTRVSTSDGRALGRARLAWLEIKDSDSPALTGALDALFEGRMDTSVAIGSAALADPTESMTASPEEEPEVAPAVQEHKQPALSVQSAPVQKPARKPWSRTKKLRIASDAMGLWGLGLLATGVAYEIKRSRADEDINQLGSQSNVDAAAFDDAQARYDRAAQLRWIGMAGGALLTAAVPMTRIDVKNGVPWWSYALGAGGVALAAWGAVDLAKDGACELTIADTGECVDRRESKGRGALALAAAAPLLTFPISHLIEWNLRKSETKTQAYLAPSSTSLMLVLRKEISSW